MAQQEGIVGTYLASLAADQMNNGVLRSPEANIYEEWQNGNRFPALEYFAEKTCASLKGGDSEAVQEWTSYLDTFLFDPLYTAIHPQTGTIDRDEQLEHYKQELLKYTFMRPPAMAIIHATIAYNAIHNGFTNQDILYLPSEQEAKERYMRETRNAETYYVFLTGEFVNEPQRCTLDAIHPLLKAEHDAKLEQTKNLQQDSTHDATVTLLQGFSGLLKEIKELSIIIKAENEQESPRLIKNRLTERVTFLTSKKKEQRSLSPHEENLLTIYNCALA